MGCALIVLSLVSARPRSIIEREFILRGDAAVSGAKALGLIEPGTLVLPWRHGDNARNCSYGLPENETSSPRCEAIQPPTNVITYSRAPEPMLRLRGSWHDERTGSGPNLARFSFSSPPRNEAAGDWLKLFALKRIRDRSKVLPFVDIEYFGVAESTRLTVSVAEEPERQQKKKKRQYDDCLKTYSGIDGAPC